MGAPIASPSRSTPSSAHSSRSRVSTNFATKRAGWSAGISSSRVGGRSHTWSRVISRNGITRLLMSSTKRRIHLPHYRLPVVTSEEATPIDVVPSGDTARSPRSADWSRDAGHPASTAVRSACIPPRPTRRSRMRRADRRKPSPCVPTSPRGTSPGYTAEQREQLQLGLRILARMIVRAHLRREASLAILASAETASEAEASG